MLKKFLTLSLVVALALIALMGCGDDNDIIDNGNENEGYNISGRVIDLDEQGIEGVRVLIDGEEVISTDEDGKWEGAALEEEVAITVLKEGYEIYPTQIKVSEEEDNIIFWEKGEAEITDNEMVSVEAGTVDEYTIEYIIDIDGEKVEINPKTFESITIENDFHIGKYHVTQSEFEELMGYNPSFFSGFPDNPAEFLSWYEAIKYCNALSKKEDLEKYYIINEIDKYQIEVEENKEANGYRLPTSDEWEYAARGGINGEPTAYAGSNNLDEVAWYSGNSDKRRFIYESLYFNYEEPYMRSGQGTMPVGQKKPNELDLYDMSGNVVNWTNTKSEDIRSRPPIVIGINWAGAGYGLLNYSGPNNKGNQIFTTGFRLARNSSGTD